MDGIERAVDRGDGLGEPELMFRRAHIALGNMVGIVQANGHDLAWTAHRGVEMDIGQCQRVLSLSGDATDLALNLRPACDQVDHVAREAGGCAAQGHDALAVQNHAQFGGAALAKGG